MCIFVINLFCPPFSWQQHDIDHIEDAFLINDVLAVLL